MNIMETSGKEVGSRRAQRAAGNMELSIVADITDFFACGPEFEYKSPFSRHGGCVVGSHGRAGRIHSLSNTTFGACSAF
jgi:hypothetical protein